MAKRWWMLSVFFAATLALGCSDDSAGVPDGGSLDDGATADVPRIDDGGNAICTEDEQRFYPGCEGGAGFVTITEGCYQPCNDADDTRCGPAGACRQAWVNPCVCDPTPGVSCCEACGASQWLCLSKTLPYPLENVTASCDGKFSAQEVLDSLLPTYAATFTYATDATTALTLGLAYESGQLICHPQIDPPPGSAAPTKPAELEMPLKITFVTADGGFGEAIFVTVRAQLAMVAFSKEVDSSLISGNGGGPVGTKTIFQGSLGATTTDGYVRVRDDSAGGGVVNVGSWSTESR